MKIFITIALFCFLLPISQSEAQNYSRVDGAPSYDYRDKQPGYIGPPHRSEDNEFHRECMDNPDYALADGLLNATWSLLKKQLSDREYKEILQDQRRWISDGRDRSAQRYMDEMSEVKAYTKATNDRINELTRRIGVLPKDGKYSSSNASFRISVHGGRAYIEGDANRGYHLCSYEASGPLNNSWIRMRHDDFSDFYVLFFSDGAEIYYNSSEMDQGCATGAGFSGYYVRD